jgi:hypothetical protein
MTSTLQYPFAQSRGVVEKLREAQQTIPLRPLQAPSEVPAFEYIDQSLALLSSHLQTQDKTLSHEFTQQRRFISDLFRSAFEDQARRDVDLQEKFVTSDQEVSKGFQEVQEQFKKQEEQFKKQIVESELRVQDQFKKQEEQIVRVQAQFKKQEARERNAHKFRLHHSVEPVPQITEEGVQEFPERDLFPRTIKHFWKLCQYDQSTLQILPRCLMLIIGQERICSTYSSSTVSSDYEYLRRPALT